MYISLRNFNQVDTKYNYKRGIFIAVFCYQVNLFIKLELLFSPGVTCLDSWQVKNQSRKMLYTRGIVKRAETKLCKLNEK